MKNEPSEIIVHHTADSYNGLQFQKVNSYHKEKDFPRSSLGYFCGYHYLIERNGELRQARNDNEEGAHCKGRNFVSIGICLTGNFNIEIPTKEQEETLGALCADLMTRYNIPISKIIPHRTYTRTECFGSLLKDDWAQFKVIQSEINYLLKAILWIKIKLGY